MGHLAAVDPDLYLEIRAKAAEMHPRDFNKKHPIIRVLEQGSPVIGLRSELPAKPTVACGKGTAPPKRCVR